MLIRNVVRGATMAALLGMFFTFGAKAAEPQVLVSLPPLHSLVTKLLQGVATPQLLMSKQVAGHLVDLSGAQIQALKSADLVIWDGPEMEGAITEAKLVMPDLSNRTLTLSRSVPFLGLASLETPDRPSGQRDPRFWLDPRLVHMALHVITPTLVRLYPEKMNIILDNEIALMKDVHHVEHSIRAALGTTDDTPLHVGTGDLRYLEWRFNLAQEQCERGSFDPIGFNLTPGGDLYSRLMEGAQDALLACQHRKVAERSSTTISN